MRVLVNMEDKSIVVQVGERETERFINERIVLRKNGEIYEYDDGVEYALRFWLELRRIGGEYMFIVEREDGEGEWHPVCTVRFRNLAELQVILKIWWKDCFGDPYIGISVSKKEKEILSHHVANPLGWGCDALACMDVYEVVKRMLIIARKLRLF